MTLPFPALGRGRSNSVTAFIQACAAHPQALTAALLVLAFAMSPTVFRAKGFRFYFFSLEEKRMHVHVQSADGDAKFWLEPEIELAMQHGLPLHRVSEIRRLVEEHQDEIRDAWRQHIGG